LTPKITQVWRRPENSETRAPKLYIVRTGFLSQENRSRPWHSRAFAENRRHDSLSILLLRKAVERAAPRCTTRKKKRVWPHVVQHGTAIALLQSGVDIAVIALWLVHQSIEITNVYIDANLAMKRKNARKGRSDRHAVPAIPSERSIAGVLGIALTT